MNVNDMTGGKYLKAEAIKDRPLLLTIDAIRREKMSDGKDKWVMYFREMTEGLVLNKTNLNALAEIFGPETDDWERQKIVLFAAKVDFGGMPTLGIRVRLPKPQKAAPAPTPDPALPRKPTAPPVTQAEADMDDDRYQAMNDEDDPGF